MTKARRFFGLVGVGVGAAFFACGAPGTGGAPGPEQGGGASGASGSGTGSVGAGGAVFGAGGGTANVPGAGGASRAGGPASNGGSPVDLDASAAGFPDVRFHYDGSVTNGGPTSDSACASTSVTQTLSKTPADIIVAVDNSGSMTAEAGFVGTNLRNFSTQIVASGVNVHVVLISSYPSVDPQGVCIDPPLGSGGCPAQDTNLPNFLHVDQNVESNDAFRWILDTYPQWQSMLRPNATKHVVVVTDDESDMDQATFNTAFLALNPALAGYKFHAIYAYTAPDFFACLGGGDVCCGLAAAEGQIYRGLVAQTGGVQGNLCTQDFGPVFNALQTAVVTGSGFLCTLPMPTPSSGIVDPEQVAVTLKWQGNPTGTTLGRVGDGGGCTPQTGGWYYDNPGNPTTINVCPSTCDAAKAQTEPRLEVFLGCLGS